jgi:hypothetical protein
VLTKLSGSKGAHPPVSARTIDPISRSRAEARREPKRGAPRQVVQLRGVFPRATVCQGRASSCRGPLRRRNLVPGGACYS